MTRIEIRYRLHLPNEETRDGIFEGDGLDAWAQSDCGLKLEAERIGLLHYGVLPKRVEVISKKVTRSKP